uniref:Thyrotropin subunit beta-like n=1 Tax=Sinocyclocheilus anshuiensis TaxID=1608454 RepID=A0A671L8A6_9TELE
MKMRMFICSLLFVLGGDVLLACSLKNYTLYVERHECGHCMAVNTTMCMSIFCGKRFLIQRGCMHHSLVYHSAKMPGCPVHTDPLFFYPVARRCRCTKCNTTKNECVYKPKHTPSKCSEGCPPHYNFPLISFFSLLMFW